MTFRRTMSRPTCCRLTCRVVPWMGATLLMAALPALSGCGLVGYAATAVTPPTTIQAAYTGLSGKSCAVAVWADNGTLDDYHAIQLDTAKGIEFKMNEAAKANIKEAANIHWVAPEQVLKYQEDHPDLDPQSAEELAPELGVERLLYVEVEDFSTHPNDSPDLSRGSMTATLEIIEVKDGKGKVVYTERGINVVAPEKCPPVGLPNLCDDAVYQATVSEFTSELCKRLVPHEEDAES